MREREPGKNATNRVQERTESTRSQEAKSSERITHRSRNETITARDAVRLQREVPNASDEENPQGKDLRVPPVNETRQLNAP